MIYNVPVIYTFRGVIAIKADNASEARKIALEECGANLGTFHTNNLISVVDWDIPITPEKHAGIILGGRHE
jgi:hypothetical protein